MRFAIGHMLSCNYAFPYMSKYKMLPPLLWSHSGQPCYKYHDWILFEDFQLDMKQRRKLSKKSINVLVSFLLTRIMLY